MPEADAFTEAFRTRRSIRRYTDDPVPRQTLDYLLEMACWSPSAHNRQPWRFALITTPDEQVRLARAMNARLRADLTADGVPSVAIEADVNRSFSRITGAPVLVCLCLSMRDMDTYPDALRNHNERIMAVQSVAMAGQNLLLAAHQVGLGACWMCAPLFCPDVVRQTLALPSDWDPQALITLGYPAQTRHKDRIPAQEVTLWR